MSGLRVAAQRALESLQELNGWQSLAPPATSQAAVQAAINLSAALAEPVQERNFCPRCGKRTNDIHTCTPPQLLSCTCGRGGFCSKCMP